MEQGLYIVVAWAMILLIFICFYFHTLNLNVRKCLLHNPFWFLTLANRLKKSSRRVKPARRSGGLNEARNSRIDCVPGVLDRDLLMQVSVCKLLWRALKDFLSTTVPHAKMLDCSWTPDWYVDFLYFHMLLLWNKSTNLCFNDTEGVPCRSSGGYLLDKVERSEAPSCQCAPNARVQEFGAHWLCRESRGLAILFHVSWLDTFNPSRFELKNDENQTPDRV